MKCEICHDERAEWAWQPFGPAVSPDLYVHLGSQTKGFPVIKVGGACKNAFQMGDFEVRFTYNGLHFLGKDHQVKEILSTVDLWDGGASSYEHARGDAQLVMHTTVETPELVAMVSDPALLNLFLAAPALLAACEEIDVLREAIERYASHTGVHPEYRRAVGMALAKVSLALKSARGEE